jgi:hypothetical protein
LLLGLFFVACTPEPPPPPPEPTPMGEVATLGGVEISVVAFAVGSPDFVDTSSRAGMPPAGSESMSVLTLEFRNTTEAAVRYSPQHSASSEASPQLSSLPDSSGNRSPIERIVAPPNFFSVGQVTSPADIPAGGTLRDDYLFREPPKDLESLLLVIPGTLVGQDAKQFVYFSIPNQPGSISDAAGELKKPLLKGDVKVTIVDVQDEYVEAVKVSLKEEDQKMKYPYAYTLEPVLKVTVEFENVGKEKLFYAPGHRAADSSGVQLSVVGMPVPLARFKLADANAQAKDQIKKVPFELAPGAKQRDAFLFQRPPSSGQLEFMLSGHLFGVKGLMRFVFPYTRKEPAKPDLEPYKNEAPAEPTEAPK